MSVWPGAILHRLACVVWRMERVKSTKFISRVAIAVVTHDTRNHANSDEIIVGKYGFNFGRTPPLSKSKISNLSNFFFLKEL